MSRIADGRESWLRAACWAGPSQISSAVGRANTLAGDTNLCVSPKAVFLLYTNIYRGLLRVFLTAGRESRTSRKLCKLLDFRKFPRPREHLSTPFDLRQNERKQR